MLTHDTTTQPLRAPVSRPVAAAIIAMLLTAFILTALVAGSLVTTPRTATGGTGEITDGWRAYLGSAAAPRTRGAAIDGWSSYLLTDPSSSGVTDGWLTRYGSR